MIVREEIRVNDFLPAGSDSESGAVVTFAGVVRSENGGRAVTEIFYDCYDELATKEIDRIADELKAEGTVNEVCVVHRVGAVSAGETSLFVVVRAAHRREAFDAVARVVEEIKYRVPIWKKEHYADQTTRWL